MKKKTILFICLFLGIVSARAYCQEWTDAQKEVWQVVEDSWTKWKAEDIDGIMTFLHEKYQGWSNESPLPGDKESYKKWLPEEMKRMKIEFYEINPARISIAENAAVVDYYFYFEMTYTQGEKKKLQEWYGKNAEFYVKEDGKWLLLGDMTISNKYKD